MKKFKKVLFFTMIFTLVWNVTTHAQRIVKVDHAHTKNEIIEFLKKYPHTGFDYREMEFSRTPNLTAPYEAGSVSQNDLDDALNAIKVVRYLAGVPYENIRLTEELNSIAQHGAVILASSNQFSHYPIKPYDMSDAFYEIAKKGCMEANISAGRSNLSNAVLGFIFDNGQNNISRVGHRRWILKPGAENFGLGYAKGTDTSYGGDRINMHVFDGLGYWECESDSYIAWPAAGDFPIEYFAASKNISTPIVAPWSINLGASYQEPDKTDVVVKLTRERDQKTWVFDKNTPDLGTVEISDDAMHLSVDNGGYGMQKAIVFRPDMSSLGTIKEDDVFTVRVSGIKSTDGKPEELTYTIRFFNLSKAIDNKIILKIGERKASVFGNEAYSDVAPIIVNDRTMLPAGFVAENLGAEVLWDESERKVTIIKKSKKIELFIDSDVAYVNGKKIIIDSPAFIQKNRTYAPVRFIVENLDADVSWDGSKAQVTIFAH